MEIAASMLLTAFLSDSSCPFCLTELTTSCGLLKMKQFAAALVFSTEVQVLLLTVGKAALGPCIGCFGHSSPRSSSRESRDVPVPQCLVHYRSLEPPHSVSEWI